jgi:hypothetical protein
MKLIIDALNAIGSDFLQNELAYLALTSKVEMPVRDKLAYKLHSNPSCKEIVAREWKRVDIALLEDKSKDLKGNTKAYSWIDNTNPKALIELKAMYTGDFNLEKGTNQYIDALKVDSSSMEIIGNEIANYNILLATHIEDEVESPYPPQIKYPSIANRTAGNNIEEVINDISGELEEHFEKESITPGVIDAGEAFGLKVKLMFWVIETK